MKNIFLASDHAGYILKEKIIESLPIFKFDVIDLGTNSDISVDYPDFAEVLTNKILEINGSVGILICGSGIGMSIAANRKPGIRAALCMSVIMSQLARAHNDANVLVLGAKLIDDALAIEIVQKFLNEQFEGGRHINRLNKLK